MKCPHCNVVVHLSFSPQGLGRTGNGSHWVAHFGVCPNCDEAIINLLRFPQTGDNTPNLTVRGYPRGAVRPVAVEVDARYADGFKEASRVLADSPKASAAVSRRLLQDVIREKAGIKERDLDTEIQKLVASKALPSHLAENLDAVRVVGNFAAHPIKSQQSGAVVEVEEGEAEWLLDVLDGMFDFYFVLPEQQKAKRAAINAKLQEAGKPPLKTT